MRRKQRRIPKPRLPQGTFVAQISELLTDGRGLATTNGKATMISGALPQETVEFFYHNEKKQFFEGVATAVLKPSPCRVEPKCPTFNHCGGCTLQHLAADQQVTFKTEQLLGNLKKQARVVPQTVAKPLTSTLWGYRRRARVGIKVVNGCVTIGFRGRLSSHIVDIERCDVLASELSVLLSPIRALIAQMSQPDSFSQVEMALGDTVEKHSSKQIDDNKQVALSFRHLAPLTEEDLTYLTAFGQEHTADIYLQSGDKDSIVGLQHDKNIHYFIEVKTEQDIAINRQLPRLIMDFLPYHFTQVNFAMNQKMLMQALSWLDLQPDDEVLDLFCGLGNFTLPIAQRVRRVVGVEGSKALVNWAKHNAAQNQINNADFYQADLAQDTRMMAWRVKYQYNKVLIDPPRAGAQNMMSLIHALAPKKIVYVSCHPATLARDIAILVNEYGYHLSKAGAMDMFTHTVHVESMVLLEKR